MSQNSNFNQAGKLPNKPPAMGGGDSAGTSGKAIASLVLGLLSFVLVCFAAIPGLILGIMGLSDINRSQGRIGGKALAIFGIVLSSMGMVWTIVALLVGLMLPAIQVTRQAARETQSVNNVRQMVLSMHNYESKNQKFPLQNRNGLSWRVHVLPYIEEGNLYERFNLDEPWDSPHNIQLLGEMPSTFECPNVVLEPGFTVYQVPYTDLATNSDLNDIALFDTSGVGTGISQIRDGTSFTAMVLEVNPEAAVEWTKPADWEFDPADPTRDLGGVNPSTIIVGFADGSTQRLPKSIDPKIMKAIMTRAGGEVLPRSPELW